MYDKICFAAAVSSEAALTGRFCVKKEDVRAWIVLYSKKSGEESILK
jgi:hypothetical protein